MRGKGAADLGLLWLRMLMGLGIASHGFAKIAGGRMEQFAQGIASMGFVMPTVFAWAAALSELVGGLLIAAGLGTRAAAALVWMTMTVAAFIRHGADPFSTKELALAYWTMAGALVFLGAGSYSLDRKLVRGQSPPYGARALKHDGDPNGV